MKKIVVASDSFKGCLSSADVAACCAEAVAGVMPDCNVVRVVVGDGGEGTTAALAAAMGARTVDCVVTDPLMRSMTATYAISADDTTAMIDVAAASGLTLVEPTLRNPMRTTSYGTGCMIADAVGRGCRRILAGIGGSATNDGGMGMLQALGYRFYDRAGALLGTGCGALLDLVHRVDASHVPATVMRTDFVVACDVDNRLYGPQGAARVFARQKGADDDMVEALDAGLRVYARALESSGFAGAGEVAGGGAAGGIGAAFAAVLGARLQSGIDVVLDAVGFDRLIAGADLIITGEGHIDRQTLMGKAPYGVLRRAASRGIPVVAICGAVDDADALRAAGFREVVEVRPSGMPLSEAMLPDVARRNIVAAVGRLLRQMTM